MEKDIFFKFVILIERIDMDYKLCIYKVIKLNFLRCVRCDVVSFFKIGLNEKLFNMMYIFVLF